MKLLRRLYDWVLGWADTPYGGPALFLLALAESSFFPVPPDVLLIALGLAAPLRAWHFALVCSLGSVIGGALGYAIGAFMWGSLSAFFFDVVPGFTPEIYAKVEGLFREHGFLIIFAAGFTPIPYKVFTITAGVWGMNFPLFLLASAVSRSARFFLVAAVIRRFGDRARTFLEERFEVATLAFAALLIAGFAAIKLLL